MKEEQRIFRFLGPCPWLHDPRKGKDAFLERMLELWGMKISLPYKRKFLSKVSLDVGVIQEDFPEEDTPHKQKQKRRLGFWAKAAAIGGVGLALAGGGLAVKYAIEQDHQPSRPSIGATATPTQEAKPTKPPDKSGSEKQTVSFEEKYIVQRGDTYDKLVDGRIKISDQKQRQQIINALRNSRMVESDINLNELIEGQEIILPTQAAIDYIDILFKNNDNPATRSSLSKAVYDLANPEKKYDTIDIRQSLRAQEATDELFAHFENLKSNL